VKLNQVLVEVLDASTVAALQTAVNGFLDTIGEATYVDIQYQVAGTPPVYSAMIIYAK